MKVKKFISIMPRIFLIFFVFILSTSLHAYNSSNPDQEGKLRGISLTGDPMTLHKVLIGFKSLPGITEEAFVRGKGGTIKYTYHLVPAIAATIPEAAIEALLKNPRVTYIELDGKVQAIDDELDRAWSVERIGAGIVHEAGNKGSEVRVAIIDTGIDKDHEDLINIAGGVNYVPIRGKINPDAWDDDNGHGTHCAGIVAAADNDIGVVGVAPHASLYAVKVLNRRGSGLDSDVIKGIEWSVDGPDGNPETDDDADVISMSLGADGHSETLENACDNAYAAGLILVAAAGNGSGGEVTYPAAYDSVVAVSATDYFDNLAFFSSVGPQVELAAPGVEIYSTYNNGGYTLKSGTSMACPHVAGTAALVIAAGMTDNIAVRQRLQDTADDLGDPDQDSWYGFGLVDAAEAANIGDPPPDVSIILPVDNQELSDNPYRVLVDANDNGAITKVELRIDGNDYIDITPNIDENNNYFYDWDTTSCLEDSSHTLRARATDDADPVQSSESIIVNVTVNNINDLPIAAFTYSCSGLTCDFDASGSYDPDGTIASYHWDFGDDGSDYTTLNSSVSYIYADAGTYSVILTVTDGSGATATTDSQNVTVSETQDTMHVGDLDGAKKLMGPLWKASVTVTIHDASHNPVPDATVTGEWSGAASGTVSGPTGSDGTVTFTTERMGSGDSVTFTVSHVTHSLLTYDSTKNHDDDDVDSNGTSITVSK